MSYLILREQVGFDVIMGNSIPYPGSSSLNVMRGPFLRREEVQGKTVVGLDANVVGTIGDLAISAEGKVAIQVNRKNPDQYIDERDIFLESNEILAIGDVVLLRHSSASVVGKQLSISNSDNVSSIRTTSKVEPAEINDLQTGFSSITSAEPSSPTVAGPGGICSRCNYPNVTGARFCIKCGTDLK